MTGLYLFDTVSDSGVDVLVCSVGHFDATVTGTFKNTRYERLPQRYVIARLFAVVAVDLEQDQILGMPPPVVEILMGAFR